MDPLTQLIKLLRPHGLRWKRLDAFGDWALQFAGHSGVSFCMVSKGSCSIQLVGRPGALLGEGDLILLNAPSSWALNHGEHAHLENFETTYAGLDGRIACVGESDSGLLTQLLGGQISFESSHVKLLRGVLPAMLRFPASAPSSERLQNVLEWIGEEAISDRPGRSLILERLLEVMLVEAMRFEPADTSDQHGLLAGLADPQLAAALRVMHTQFQRTWTVAELGSVGGMSRSVFAERFSRTVGLSPIDYLSELRMAVAKDALVCLGKRPSDVAFLCGYQSIAAFTHAFRRSVGCSPGAYAKGRADQTI
ncbi:MAG: AraC family transcriptional regulator [Janthinobacterium lividum]